MKVTIVSPYHGGSHRSWAVGYQQNSKHEVVSLTLPDRFWKWRMHGGGVTLARRFLAAEMAAKTDLVLATDMLDLATFAALTRHRLDQTPLVLYMHENQLTYPLPADGETGPMRRQKGERDLHYAFINYASMLTADLVLFNSQFHQDSFFAALPRFLKHFPEYNELGTVAVLADKSQVLPVGVDFTRLVREGSGGGVPSDEPPLIIWNQRWEYDKNPEGFFQALFQIAAEGVPFRLALCGQQYGKRPSIFTTAIQRLADQIVHVGYAEPKRYRNLLWEAAVTVSTAHHEFFGISILEAVYCHTFPILPHRLSYPELIPSPFHEQCLYDDEEGLQQRLRRALVNPDAARSAVTSLATAVSAYDWIHMAPRYDTVFTDLGERPFS